MWDLTAK
nr:truncated vpu protein [Human immunodeficiency virus 1]